MEKKEFETTVDKNGCIAIPVAVLKEMNLEVGNHLKVNYNKPNEVIDYCFTIESKNSAEESDELFCLPKELLDECGIDITDGTAHILCFKDEITITNESKMLSEVPSIIMNLCLALGISKEQIANALAQECCRYE